MIIKKEIEFKASKEKVWDLLTNPEMTKQYMFGCKVLSNWNIGEPIVWEGLMEDGTKINYVKGNIIEHVPGEKVSFTMFDPNMGIQDIPENYVKLTYELSNVEIGTKLAIIQGDFSGTENAENRFEESKKGWEMVIPIMKEMIGEL